MRTQGLLNRRELLAGLGGLAATVTQARASESLFRATTINHMSLTVPDLEKAYEFYREMLGMRIFRKSERAYFLGLKRNYLALFKGDQADLNHFSPGIENYDGARAGKLLQEKGYEPFERAPNIWACMDPDGIQNHASGTEHREDQVAEAYKKDPKPDSVFQAVDVNHVALRVTDVDRSREFYQNLFGVGVISLSERSCFLRFGDNFLALFQGTQGGGVDHFCFSIEDYEAGRVVAVLEQKGFKPRRTQNRVYFKDPHGLTVQLSAAGHRP